MATTDKPADRYPDSEGPFAGPNNTFPLNTAARVKNAWARIHQAAVIANHSAAEIASIKAKIRARAKELGIKLEEHDHGGDSVDNDSTSSLERMFTPGAVEIRSAAGARTVGGYAARFGTLSRRLAFGHEMVGNSFFDESRRGGFQDVVARWNHDSFHLLGAVNSGTLRLTVDSRGLDYSVDLPEHRSDLLELIQRQDVSASSFAFEVAAGGDAWEYRDGSPVRTLLSGRLIDVAPVDQPAYFGTSAALRSLARHMQAPYDDVKELAAQGELRRLFTTGSDGGRRPMTAAQARVRLEELRQPQSVTIEQEYRRRRLHLHARRMSWH